MAEQLEVQEQQDIQPSSTSTYRELIVAALQAHDGTATHDQIVRFVDGYRKTKHLSSRMHEYEGRENCWRRSANQGDCYELMPLGQGKKGAWGWSNTGASDGIPAVNRNVLAATKQEAAATALRAKVQALKIRKGWRTPFNYWIKFD